MMRPILTLCCLALLGGAIAVAAPGANQRPNSGLERQSVRLNHPSADDRQLDCQHSLPLLADADETDDSEELSDHDEAVAYYASHSPRDGPSPGAACFEAAVQHRLANTLNALGVRLQI